MERHYERFATTATRKILTNPVHQHNEAQNHHLAIKYLMDLVSKKKEQVGQQEILNIHQILLTGINNEWAGRYRRQGVYITGSSHKPPHPSTLVAEMEVFISWLHSSTLHPVLLAAEAHYRLVLIHPFADGNGRTSRLLMNLLLLQYGYPLTVIRAKEERPAYIQALHSADAGDLGPFFLLVAKSVLHSLKEYIDTVTVVEMPNAPQGNIILG